MFAGYEVLSCSKFAGRSINICIKYHQVNPIYVQGNLSACVPKLIKN